MYLKMLFPCFVGFFQVDWSSLRHCPKKIQTNGIIPMFL